MQQDEVPINRKAIIALLHKGKGYSLLKQNYDLIISLFQSSCHLDY